MGAIPDDRRGGGRYLQALGQHWPFIALSLLLTVGAAAAYVTASPKRYVAHADVLVSPVPAGTQAYIGIPLISESATSRSVLTAARLVKTPQVADAVRRRLRLRTTRTDLLGAIDVTPQEQSNIVTIGGRAGTPAAAARLANAFADVLLAQRTELFQRDVRAAIRRLAVRLARLGPAASSPEATALASRLGDLRELVGAQDPTLELTSRAVEPTSPSWPRPALSLVVAAVAGILLGVGLAIFLELVNPLVLHDDDLLVEQRLPILARLPRPARHPRPSDRDEEREAFRTARLTLAAAGSARGLPRGILVTSAIRDEGRTAVATGLAISLAVAGADVVLIEGDLRHPTLGELAGNDPATPTLNDVLADPGSANSLIEADGLPGRLRLLPARSSDPSGIDLLHSGALGRLLDGLDADHVVIDSPPVTLYADALAMTDVVDAVVVAVRLGRSRRKLVAELRRLLAQRGVVAAGAIVLPRTRLWHARRTAIPQLTTMPARKPGTGHARTKRRRTAAGLR